LSSSLACSSLSASLPNNDYKKTEQDKTQDQTGNLRKLIPGPWTPTMDWVRRLPMDQSTDYPYEPSLRTTPKNRIKIRNKYFTYWLSNRLLVLAKFRTLVCKCNILGFRLGHKLYHYTLPFPLLWPYSI